ncbi:MAG TPA: hypothetical protein ENF38_00455, partial [Candidatus Aenigmarchaeota archaeon]|nr:hypothetical protein [Candidatus Aenigmarchaeota archaeon]
PRQLSKALRYKNSKGISTKYNYDPLRLTIKKLAKYFDDEYLKFISSDDIAWMRIKNIRIINRLTKVYDVEVNDKHNFIGNGIILHNSYSAGTLIEELCRLEEKYREKIAAVIFDPVGIYWSMKFPNKQQEDLLKEWKLTPKGFKEIKVYVPFELREIYEKAGIPVDYTISISPKEFLPEDWSLAFNLERTSELAITLEKNFNQLLKEKEDFDLEELKEKIDQDRQASQHTKNVLISFLEVAKAWGIFKKEGMKIQDIVKPGQVSIIDVSRVKGEEWGVRNLLAAWITRNVYRERVLARKEEELAKLEKRKPKKVFPLTWLIFEEAHNFIPSDKKTVSTEPILTIAKQGREPGVSLVVITQMPNKIHPDILAQTDIVISFRLTSKDDVDALHAVMQTYVREDIERFLNRLPRWPGAAIILDDNLEKIFTVNIRPRISWHSGGTAIVK